MRGVRPSASRDATALTAGLVLVVFGAVLALDAAGAISLSFAALAPIACAAVGVVLLVSGLSRRG